MAIRIPNEDEHARLVTTFRGEVRKTSVDDIVDAILNPASCYCVDAAGRNSIRTSIFEKYGLGGAQCYIVGSAQLGFSLVSRTNAPRYRPFSQASDIDVAIVSSEFYDLVWEDTFLHFVRQQPWPTFQDFQKYFFRGWIRPDKLPRISPFRSEWFDYFRTLSRDLFDSQHQVTCALYKSAIFLKEYQKLAVKECKDSEEIQ
jgi:hypothetical protein